MSLIIAAPIEGWAAPLQETPDAVFAERMMGDGLAIDPLGSTLYAPCDGEIASLPATGHAIVVRASGGAEILIHVGLETVALGGEGFIAHVYEGQRVKTGDRLISFDLDFLAQHAKSLITPVVLANGERFDIVRRTLDRAVSVGEALMEISPRGAAEAKTAGAGHAQRIVRIVLEHGIHARPAAAMARAAQAFAVEINASAHGRGANAKSIVALMTLGVKHGDALTIEARGEDAEAAVEAVARAVSEIAETGSTLPFSPERGRRWSRSDRMRGRFGTEDAASMQHSILKRAPSSGPSGHLLPLRGEKERVIHGVCASPGLAIGVAFRVNALEFAIEEAGAGVFAESTALAHARAAAIARIESANTSDILEAHKALLDDPDLVSAARKRIEEGKSAGFAWRAAIRDLCATIEGLGDRYLAERVADLKDVEAQVLSQLVHSQLGGAAQPLAQDLPPDAILIADELLPSQFASLDRARIAGFCTAGGGPTSHVAILAATMGVPALVAAGPRVLDIETGTPLALGASAGVLGVNPPATELEALRALVEAKRKQANEARLHAREESRIADGARIPVYANLGALGEAQAAIALGAEGCGLLRTEFLFQDRDTPPSEEEQRSHYQAIADALEGRPLIIRTLDAGGDKPLAFLPLPREDNPALGVRGLRASLTRPDLLRAQLAAIARVQSARILLPMVNDVADIAAVRALMREIGLEAPLGVMIETPAAAMMSEQLARDCDFFSVGANDLTQYALAMDRGHPALAAAIDALHPAVLRLMQIASEGAKKHERPIGVCGAIASDPLAAPLLIGLGIDSLSAAPSSIPDIKARVRSVRIEDCRATARAALALADAHQVRALARARWGESA